MTKQITLALAMIGLSTSVFAGIVGNQVAMPAGVDLIAPDSVGVWSIGIEGLYYKPSNNDFTYAQEELLTAAGSRSGDRDNESVTRNHRWGGTIDIAYLFPGNSRDVKLSYTTYRANGHDSAVDPDGLGTAGSLIQPFSGLDNSASLQFAEGEQKDRYDSADLVFGQWIKIGERVDLHPFGGLRYARLRSTYEGEYDYLSTTTGAFIGEEEGEIKSRFSGIGPRAGFDTAVHLGYGFSVVGTFGGSLTVGSQKSNMEEESEGGVTGIVAPFELSTKNDSSHTAIVPELDARIGLDYMFAFNPTTSMNVQIGYQVVNYFGITEFDNLDGSNPSTEQDHSDFGFQGPYLRLQLNVA